MISQSTVVLSVNVGFLAIPGVVISNLNSNITGANQVIIFTSPAQVASCMSIVASAGGIVIGLLLVRRNSPKQNEDPAGAVSEQHLDLRVKLSGQRQSIYLCQITRQVFGLEPMSIVFSLPWALLMWS